MTLLSPATDWTNETNETRAEECARFLCTHMLITLTECRRIMGTVREAADGEREMRKRTTV